MRNSKSISYIVPVAIFLSLWYLMDMFWLDMNTVVVMPPRTLHEREQTVQKNYWANISKSGYPRWISSYFPSNVTDLQDLSREALLNIYFSYTESIETTCERKIRLGNIGDGGWDVCDDLDVQPRKPCLIYSFGISDDWSFDDAAEKIYGCEIHSFDPSMKIKEHNRSKLIQFHKIGLSGSDYDGKWKMRTLATIKRNLHHKERILDVLKMDIELSEWPVLLQSLTDSSLENVKQLNVEFHLRSEKEDLLKCIQVFLSLQKSGFHKYFARKNIHCVEKRKFYKGSITGCVEVNYLNKRFQRRMS